MKTGVINHLGQWPKGNVFGVQFSRLQQAGYSVPEFLEWAFDAKGSDPIEKTWENWNKKHGDLFMIEPTGRPDEDFPRIVDEFMKSKEAAIGFTQ